MANKKLSDGVGKKIVEALKKQSDVEITPIPVTKKEPKETINLEEVAESLTNEIPEAKDESEQNNEELVSLPDDFSSDVQMDNFDDFSETSTMNQPFVNYQQMPNPQDAFIKELDTFEIPSNIAVLKKLITQLPTGVTRHTGAQIIKQTMEALGISMKSVLQEAQQVQEGLNISANECYNNIQEYKKQIVLLEKQAQNYHRQYTALNELISLFIQTGL